MQAVGRRRRPRSACTRSRSGAEPTKAASTALGADAAADRPAVAERRPDPVHAARGPAPAAAVGERIGFALQVTEAAPFTVELAEPAVTLAALPAGRHPARHDAQGRVRRPDHASRRAAASLADKAEGRTRVYAEFPEATAQDAEGDGSVHRASWRTSARRASRCWRPATHGGATITLIRTFDLEITHGVRGHFAGGAGEGRCPGEHGQGDGEVERVKTFAGPVTVRLSPHDGLECPETVTIPAGQDGGGGRGQGRRDGVAGPAEYSG